MFKGHKPLLGCSINDGLTITLSVRIAVGVIIRLQQHSQFIQAINHYGIAIFKVNAFEFTCFMGQDAFFVNRVWHREVVGLPGEEVISTMAWRGVDDASTVFGSDIARHDRDTWSIKDRVFERHILEVDTFKSFDRCLVFPVKGFGDLWYQVLEDEIMILPYFD